MPAERSHVTEWAEFVDAEVQESALSEDRDDSSEREW